MKCVLGFDGGGTKTECVAMNEGGEIVGRGRGGPSNPARIGFPAAMQGVVEAADAAIRSVNSQVQVVALCAGLAGTGLDENRKRMYQLIAEAFSVATVTVCTDLELPLAAAPAGSAIALIVGTGSAAIGRNSVGAILREGGLGPAISDEGSAFDIGRNTIYAVRQGDSSAAVDLSRQILLHLGAANWDKVDTAIAEHADTVYPRIFPVVAAAADAGNPIAQSMLDSAAQQLAAMCARLAHRLELKQHLFPLIKVGGPIGRSRYFDTALDNELASAVPGAVISAPPFDAPATAARLAWQTWREKARSHQ